LFRAGLVSFEKRQLGSTVMVTAGCGLLLFVGAVLSIYGNESIYFHEHGVAQPSRKGWRQLFYKDIGEVTWKGNLQLTLRPLPTAPGPRIRYAASLHGPDGDLAAMRDLMCRPIAERWRSQLPRGPLRWTDRLRFLPGGLEYTPRSLLAEEPVTVPYHLIDYRMENDHLVLYADDGTRKVFKENQGVPNFFPGLMLLDLLCQDLRPKFPESAPNLPRPSAERFTGGER